MDEFSKRRRATSLAQAQYVRRCFGIEGALTDKDQP